MKQTLIRYSSKYVESKLTRHGVNHSPKTLVLHLPQLKRQNRNISTAEEGDKNGFKKCLGSSHKGKHKIQLEWRMRMDGGSSSNPIRSRAERGGRKRQGFDSYWHHGIQPGSSMLQDIDTYKEN